MLAALVTALWLLPIDQLMFDVQAWVENNPEWSLPAVIVFLILGILLMLPISVMMMVTGFLFGMTKAFLAVWFAILIASTAAFLIARKLARPMIERRLTRKPYFMAIDRAIRQKGFYVVLLTRLILILPFPALSYSHGLTDVRLRDYVAGTMMGMVPVIFLFVYLGTLASDIADIVNGRVSLEGGQLLAVILGSVVVLLLATVIVVAAKKALQGEIERAQNSSMRENSNENKSEEKSQ